MNFVHENCARVSCGGRSYESVTHPSGVGCLFENVDPADREAFLSVPGMSEEVTEVPAAVAEPAPEPVAVLSAEVEPAPEPTHDAAEPVTDGPV